MLKESVDHLVGSPNLPRNVTPNIPRSPYKAVMIVLLIVSTIADMTMTSYKVLCQILEPYGKPYCFTEAIDQGARTEARKLSGRECWLCSLCQRKPAEDWAFP